MKLGVQNLVLGASCASVLGVGRARLVEVISAGLRPRRPDRQGQGASAERDRAAGARHALFAYLHLAPAPELTRGLLDSEATRIAYETIVDRAVRLPLLAPMSEIAGKLAAGAGAFILQRPSRGRGILLSRMAGVRTGTVMIMGGVVVGTSAAVVAAGIGRTARYRRRRPGETAIVRVSVRVR